MKTKQNDIANNVSNCETSNFFNLSIEEIEKIKPHDLLKVLPQANANEKEALRLSIENNGMLEPITITKDFLCLDGRTRLQIYKDNPENVKAIFKYYDDTNESIYDFILRINFVKKSITPTQKAIAAVQAYELVRGLKINKTTTLFGLKLSDFKRNRELIAQYFGIGKTYISYATKVNQIAPQLFEEVIKEVISLRQAYESCCSPNTRSLNKTIIALETNDSNSELKAELFKFNENGISNSKIDNSNDFTRSISCNVSNNNDTAIVSETTDKQDLNKSKSNKDTIKVSLSLDDFEGFNELEECVIEFLQKIGFKEEQVIKKVLDKVEKEKRLALTWQQQSPNTLYSCIKADFLSHQTNHDCINLLDEKISNFEKEIIDFEYLSFEEKIIKIESILDIDEIQSLQNSIKSSKTQNFLLSDEDSIKSLVKVFYNKLSGLLK